MTRHITAPRVGKERGSMIIFQDLTSNETDSGLEYAWHAVLCFFGLHDKREGVAGMRYCAYCLKRQ